MHHASARYSMIGPLHVVGQFLLFFGTNQPCQTNEKIRLTALFQRMGALSLAMLPIRHYAAHSQWPANAREVYH